MKHLLILALSFLCAFSASAQDLRAKLETSYNTFSEAVKSKDVQKLKASLSSHSFMSIKNQMASTGSKFPEDFFKMAPAMLTELKGQTFLRVNKNGPTANAIYFGKDKAGSQTLMVISFLKEDNTWKFHFVNNETSEELTKKIKANDTTFLSGKKYMPDGIIPETPKEISAADYKGMVDVMGYGYKVTIVINGIEQTTTKGGSISRMIMGGVKKGVNKIELTVKPIEGEDPGTLSVTVRALIGDKEEDVFTLEEKQPGASITKEFTVK